MSSDPIGLRKIENQEMNLKKTKGKSKLKGDLTIKKLSLVN